ncbi:MAG TPA: HAMP domain-containing sensor histidine kinase [Gemmatimonadales bacterium]|nr:HAMP domain-containing sensor histidine kinase [Gemmatimonadales bacterium]
MTVACLADRKVAPLHPALPTQAPDGTMLVAELAHDLRSPLSAVIALAEVLYAEQAGPLNDIQRRYLGLIHNAALGLCTMASDVVDLARAARSEHGAPVPFSLRELLDGVAALCRPLAAEKGLELRFESTLAGDRWLGHPRSLSRALLNLTTNALKYTDRGRVVVAARRRRPSRVEFSVQDTGPGLDPDALRHLYEPFRPGNGRARYHFSSSGLGLAICRRLVQEMGGELSVETRLGRGTRFRFELPLTPAPTAA